MRVPLCSCSAFAAALTWECSIQILGFPPVLLGRCGFLSEMPVAHVSAELCVLSVPSCGHFFWALILPWCLYCRFVLSCLQASNGLRICLVSQSHKCPTGQHVPIMPSQWGSPSTPRLGTWGEQSPRRHCPGVQRSAHERGVLHMRVSPSVPA